MYAFVSLQALLNIPVIAKQSSYIRVSNCESYAWFTMAREVDVTGVKMTASVPANLQLSLGNDMLGGNGGTWKQLDATVDGTTARLTGVEVPGAADADPDWSNTVAISDYYTFGSLTPATSINGAKLWYTKDATGVGKTLLMNAQDSTKLAAKFTAVATSDSKLSTAVGLDTKIATKPEGFTDKYANGGAYYIDIPVWFRTSSKNDVNLAVKATIKHDTSSTQGTRQDETAFDLFKAARVSIIQGAGTVPSMPESGETVTAAMENGNAGTVTQGVIYDSTSSSYTINSKTKTLQSKYYAEDANYITGRVTTVANVPTTYDGESEAGWKQVTKIKEAIFGTSGEITNAAGTNAADTVAVVKAPASEANTNYGVPCRYTIRVWIDGEDVNCWNATAAQDFVIDLRFIDMSYTSAN